MPIPNHLTDITTYMPTPEEEQIGKDAVVSRDWETVFRYKPALVFHFGDHQVRIPTNRKAMDQLCKAYRQAEKTMAPNVQSVWQRLLAVD